MELMTYPEIAAAMNAGKTTVLIYNGGTEERGPHAVLGGHSLIARRASVEIVRHWATPLSLPYFPSRSPVVSSIRSGPEPSIFQDRSLSP